MAKKKAKQSVVDGVHSAFKKFNVGDIVTAKKHFAKIISIGETLCLSAWNKKEEDVLSAEVVGLTLNPNALSFLKVKVSTKAEDIDDVNDESGDDDGDDDGDDENKEPKTVIGKIFGGSKK